MNTATDALARIVEQYIAAIDRRDNTRLGSPANKKAEAQADRLWARVERLDVVDEFVARVSAARYER